MAGPIITPEPEPRLVCTSPTVDHGIGCVLKRAPIVRAENGRGDAPPGLRGADGLQALHLLARSRVEAEMVGNKTSQLLRQLLLADLALPDLGGLAFQRRRQARDRPRGRLDIDDDFPVRLAVAAVDALEPSGDPRFAVRSDVKTSLDRNRGFSEGAARLETSIQLGDRHWSFYRLSHGILLAVQHVSWRRVACIAALTAAALYR